MSITVYSFEDRDGPSGSYTTQDYREAKEFARKNNLRVIANEYEWVDSEMVDDFTVPSPCAYCGAYAGQRDDVPSADDGAAWAEIAEEHYDNCEWVATRGHRVDPIKGGES